VNYSLAESPRDQSFAHDGRITVVLLPDEAFHSGDPSTSKIIRAPGRSSQHFVIILRESTASAQELSNAYSGLLMLQKNDPKQLLAPDRDIFQVGRSSDIVPYGWASQTVERLRNASPSDVRGVGRHRALELR
jgi:hypothetical protein